MQRFYVPTAEFAINQTVDLTPLARQLGRVLRLDAGAQIVLFNGDGFDYVIEITEIARNFGEGVVVARLATRGETALTLTLYQCSLKNDKFEWVLQKGTELGVARFVPVISARSIVRPAAALLKKFERWQVILREAAEQSGRSRVPTLDKPLAIDDALLQAPGTRLLPYEAGAGDADTPGLRQAMAHRDGAMQHLYAKDEAGEVSLLIGPEGGFETGEIAIARANDWQIVSLGPRILRAETAAIAATTLITLHDV